MKILRTLAMAAFLALATFTPRAMATSFSTNFSDIWSTPGEPGWAVNITMQYSTLFASWFVYGADQKPIWYSATLEFVQQTTTGDLVFSGDLYVTTGPWFGAPFDPFQVALRKVGTATFTAHQIEAGTLQYSVDGVNVVKQIARYTLRSNDLTGDYYGGTSDVTMGCANPTNNTMYTDALGPITVTQSGTTVTLTTESCTFTGTYTQTGQVGAMAGNYSCTGGTSGPFTMFDIRVETSAISGRYFLRNQLCSRDGNFGGARLR